MSNAQSLAALGNFLGACIAMTLTGHYGGSMVHGDPLAKAPWKEDENYIEFLPSLEETIEVYGQLVQPVLQAKCYSCHGENSRKGRFRADSMAALLAGGENGPAIEPGKAASSLLIRLVELPAEDDRHMAPQNKPQINDAELALLKWWIAEGATPTQAVARTEAPAVIEPFLVKNYRLLPNPAEETRLRELQAEQDRLTRERRNTLISRLEPIPETLREAFAFESQEGAHLVFNPISIRTELEDEQLLSLKDLLAECSKVDLSYTQVSEAAVARLRFSEHLESLDLSGTSINVQNLPNLEAAVNLKSLNLFSTPVDRAWILDPQDWPNLHQLYVANTGLTKEDLDTLYKHFPNCEIISTLTL